MVGRRRERAERTKGGLRKQQQRQQRRGWDSVRAASFGPALQSLGVSHCLGSTLHARAVRKSSSSGSSSLRATYRWHRRLGGWVLREHPLGPAGSELQSVTQGGDEILAQRDLLAESDADVGRYVLDVEGVPARQDEQRACKCDGLVADPADRFPFQFF